MDFSVIYQLRTKKYWWMDVIFYFAISLLIAAVFCYFVFLAKNSFQRADIEKESGALQTVGTALQKEHEQNVIDYNSKVSDFSVLLGGQGFASNAFSFVQTETLPNIWFNQFNLNKNDNIVQLSGESDNMEIFSRQVAIFEGSKYVKAVGNMNSKLGESSRTEFNIDLALDKNIFSYLSGLPPIVETTTPSGQTPIQQNQTPVGNQDNVTPENNANPADSNHAQSNAKRIISFNIPINPEVVGLIDANNIVNLNVPYGTDIKNISPIIVVSPGATVSPASGALQDFTVPVIYRVTAEDGSIQGYEVRANVGAMNAQGQSGQGMSVTMIIIATLIIIIAVIVVIVLAIRRRNKQTL